MSDKPFRIDKPGIYDISADVYHADPCTRPSLSASIAKICCSDSMAHARAAHPRLNMFAKEEEAEHFDIGTLAHAILLEGEAAACVVDAKDWRTNAAKDARERARADGLVPVLVGRWPDVQQMVRAAREQLSRHKEASNMFTAGKPEQTLIWEDDGVLCRARLDWLHNSYLQIDDLKTTSATANPEVISRTLFANGWDVQEAFYRRGIKVLTGKEPEFRFFVQETYYPYAGCVIALDPHSAVIGEKKRIYAVEKWRESLESKRWPAYPDRVCWADLPAYEEARWLERELV